LFSHAFSLQKMPGKKKDLVRTLPSCRESTTEQIKQENNVSMGEAHTRCFTFTFTEHGDDSWTSRSRSRSSTLEKNGPGESPKGQGHGKKKGEKNILESCLEDAATTITKQGRVAEKKNQPVPRYFFRGWESGAPSLPHASPSGRINRRHSRVVLGSWARTRSLGWDGMGWDGREAARGRKEVRKSGSPAAARLRAGSG
jgi:hypothetical protein